MKRHESAAHGFEGYAIHSSARRIVRTGPGVVCRSGVFVGARGLLKESYHAGYEGQIARLSYHCAKSMARWGIKFVRSDGPLLLFHNSWSGGYYHWLIESLPRLFALQEHWRSHMVIVPVRLPNNWFKDWLIETFGDRCVFQTSNLLVNSVVLQENPQKMTCYNPRDLNLVREYFLERYASDERPRRLYVSRRHAGHRRVSNEDEVTRLLVRYGFECLVLEEMSFAEQVAAFASAEIVVGVHGAGLSNTLFMRPRTRLIELVQRPDSEMTFGRRRGTHLLNPCYLALCHVTGVLHTAVFCAPDFVSTAPQVVSKYGALHADVSVSVAALEDALGAL